MSKDAIENAFAAGYKSAKNNSYRINGTYQKDLADYLETVNIKSFLTVLQENYAVVDRWLDEDKNRPAQEMAKEIYEDLISIYKANYLNE